MPKEITHWLVAQQVATSLHGTRAGEAAKAFPNCLLLGSIIHDAPYYARGRWRETMAVLADAMHGKGHDFFELIESMAATSAASGPATAFLIGMISHLAADDCFHPLITHATGTYNDPDPRRKTRAVQLHRRFESILDMYLAGTMENVRTFSLKKILLECECDVPALLRNTFMQTAEDFDCPALPEGMLAGLKNYIRMQSVYANPYITRVLQTLHPCFSSGMREITALFYLPRFIRLAPELHEEWTIPDPETGCTCSVTIRELYSNSVKLAIDLCDKIVPALVSLPSAEPSFDDPPEKTVTQLCSESGEPEATVRQAAAEPSSDDTSKNSFTELCSEPREPDNA